MEDKAIRKVPKQTVAGLVCFSLSGALLAVDVGATHALQSGVAASAPDPIADATPAALVAAATCPAPARPMPSTAHNTGAALRRLPTERPVVQAKLASLCNGPVVHAFAHAGLPTLNVAANVHRPVTATFATLRTGNSDRIVVLAPHAVQPRPLVIVPAPPPRIPALAANPQPGVHLLRAAHSLRAAQPLPAAHRTSVQAAQYFAVRMVEAQTPGMHLISAVTRKRGRDRLVVHIVAHSRTATLVEYEILRRNGIGFAVESQTIRSVIAASSLAAARHPAADQSQGP